MVNFTAEEASAMVIEAHRLGRKVAAHAMGREGIQSAILAGVDTIEHGIGLDDETIDLMERRGVYWCPTIYVGIWVAKGRAPIWNNMRDLEAAALRGSEKGR
jgi:imidazolonepropionase-like amidohydrolase